MPRKPRFFVILMVIVLCAAAGLPLAAGKAEPTSQDSISASGLSAGDIRSFHLVSADEGWLLLGEDLYWTTDSGRAWQKITPPVTGQARIRAVTFLDAQSGWVMLTSEDGTGFPVYQLAQTADRGATWQVFSLSLRHPEASEPWRGSGEGLALFDPGDVSALAQSIYLDFIDPGTGWLVVKQASGSSFSLGALFKTVDGGRTWLRLPIPIGEPVYFINDEVGWVAGGAAGSELYRTQDGGLTWSAQILPGPADVKRLYWLPSFKNAQEGILPAATNTASGSQIDFYTTQDGGGTWEPAASISLGQPLAPGAQPALSMLDGSGWIMVEEDRQQVLRSENGVQTSLTAASGALPGRITGLDMATPSVGWAQTAAGDCQTLVRVRKPQPAPGAPDALTCTSEAWLLKTTDGGQTWTRLALPQTPGGITPQSNTSAVTGHGWDTCDVPWSGWMQAWMDHSPYRIWNLYIGGSRLAGCGQLTAAYISQLAGQGWKFIPTWVGPQAPCWDNDNSDISYDLATAYFQGINEANAAVEKAANLLLTKPDKTSAIIYYDLEAYNTSNTQCRNAVKSFMAGWAAQLHARGNQAAVYGSGCYGALSDFAANPQVPDAIWAAEWIHPYRFRSDATVWDISCLPNSLWSNDQRLYQYAGAHNETWGGVTFNVDSNVADGVVLDLSAGPRVHFTAPVDNVWLPTGQVTVTVVPVDPGASIDHVDFLWHSADWTGSGWVPLGTDTNGSDGWSILFNPSGVIPEGQGGAIYAWAYDSAENRSGAGVWNLGIDHTPPTVSVTTTPMYGDAPFRDFHVRWSGSDNQSGTVRYDIQYKDSINGDWTNLVTTTPDTETTFVGVNGHTYYFRGRGLDASGNLGVYSSNDVHFTIQPCPLPLDGYEADNSPAAAKVITVDGPAQAHNFDIEGDQDWVRFDAASRTAYILQTSNTGGHADTMLYLFGPDATTLLAVNDDYPGLNLASRIDWQSATAGGTYYVKVVHWDPYAAGCTTEYALSVIHAHLTLLPMVSR